MVVAFSVALGTLLCLASWVDFKRMILPNSISFAILLLGLVQSLANSLPEPVDAIIGTIIGAGTLGMIAEGYRRYRGFDGIGMGDVKFAAAAAAGAWVGWMGLPYMLLIASVSGLAYAGIVGLRAGRVDRHLAIPFGPFLAIGTFASWLMLIWPSL